MKDVFDTDEVREVLEESFFQKRERRAKRARKKKPSHYEVICISLYREDLERLDEHVRALKASGHRKMSRSALIRFALDTMDTSKLPKAY